LSLKKRGFATVVQSEESCAISGMPKAAIALGAAQQVLPLELIADEVVGFAVSSKRRPMGFGATPQS
jgi:two-component system chemotaxis response regulator CheB